MNIYEVLKKDHVEVLSLVDELISLKDDDDYREILVQQISDALIPHSRAEESVFYNTLRAVNAPKKEVFHGFKEHMEAEAILKTLQAKDKLNMEWKSVARKLKEALTHHIKEEETEIFSVAQEVFTAEEAEAMGEAFIELKPKVEEQSGLGRTADMVINLMPPRLASKIRDFGISMQKS
jgi:hemerythrin superfamily protein